MTTMTDKPGKVAAAAADNAAPKKKKSKKKLIIVLAVVLLIGGAAKYEMGAKKPAAHGAVAPKPGPLVALDAVTVNLAGGHYLRVGVTLQFTDKVSASAPPDGAPALDTTIGYFTGQDAGPLQTSAGLEASKKGLKDKITADYPKDPIYDVLFTSFVVQ
jgi:flagellar FliL protein